MSDLRQAAEMALEALETLNSGDSYKTHNAATALRQAIAEAEKQEPVAFRNTETGEFCTGGFLRKDWAKWQPLYAAPREWVGLTDEDIDLYAFDIGVTDNKAPAWLVTYARGIEAKLKEKNVPQP